MAQTFNEWAILFFQRMANAATGTSTNPVITSAQLATLTPLGYKQIAAASTLTAFNLSTAGIATTFGAGIPTGSTLAIISPEAQGVRWRDDGTDPTTAIGYRLLADNELVYYGPLTAWRGINLVAGAIVNVAFY